MPDLPRPLLIAITDRRRFTLPPDEWAHEVIAGGADLIQVREKDLSNSELVEFAALILEGADSGREAFSKKEAFRNERDPGLRPRAKKRSDAAHPDRVPEGLLAGQHGHFSAVFQAVPTIQINNAPQIARLLDCGLHLPESEQPPDRAPCPLSRSVHSLKSAQASGGFDFIIAGHIFETPSHAEMPPRGLDWLESIATAVDLPVVAIGGISSENAGACIARGASGVAVISAIASSADPRDAATDLRAEIDRAWELKHG